ncbi:RuvB-like protein 2 [Tanacetum coccineum]
MVHTQDVHAVQSVLRNQSSPSLFDCTDADIASYIAADRGCVGSLHSPSWSIHKISASLTLLGFNTNDTGPKHMEQGLVVRRQNVASVSNNGEGSKSVHNGGRYMKSFRNSIGVKLKEEAEFIEGEVVEIHIDHRLELVPLS